MPWDRRRYPADWEAIRRRILDRAGHRCEWCGAPNHHLRVGDQVVVPGGADAFYAGEDHAAGIGPRPRRIVLTIAHVHDPDPQNCADDNLAALCQRCHNRHDAPMRRANAAATRARRGGQESLIPNPSISRGLDHVPGARKMVVDTASPNHMAYIQDMVLQPNSQANLDS